MTGSIRFSLLKELRRRRVFRVAGLYVIGVWLLMQVADIVFPAWGIPDAAIRFLLWAGLAGFPVALAFGWVFDITTRGIRRTQPAVSEAELLQSLPLRPADYLLLAVFLVVGGFIVFGATERVMETATLEEWRPATREITPDSLAVLPFANLSSDPEHEYFADGVSEEILNRLSAYQEIKVIARTSSFAFKDSGFDIARISGLLGVQYLLQGSVRRDGQQLRIAAQLVEHDGMQVWSSTFDRQVGSVFALQDEIAEAVASSIVPRITPPAHQERVPDLEAWQHYAAGREVMTRRSTRWPTAAAEEFSRAIELDPEFAPPYAARATALLIGLGWGGDYESELELARQDIDQALRLDPSNARAYAAKALLEQEQNPGAHESHEALLRQALLLDPNLVDALNWLAGTMFAQNRHAEAEAVLLRAARIDPLAPVINANLAIAEARRGRMAKAERRLLRLLEVPQPSRMTMHTLCDLLSDAGRLVEALQCGKRLVLQLSPPEGRAVGVTALLMPYALLGMREEGVYWAARASRERPESYPWHLHMALILGYHTGQLSHQEALARFESALRAADVPTERLAPANLMAYGILLGFAGRLEEGLRTLETALDLESAVQTNLTEWQVHGRQTLAWLYQQLGTPAKSAIQLERLAQHSSARQAQGILHRSRDLATFSINTLLLGDREAALDLLERAEAAGWRGYYGTLQDPRWDAARDEPRFRAVMARVKADLDAQRAEAEAIEAEDDFVARLDAAIALHAASPQR